MGVPGVTYVVILTRGTERAARALDAIAGQEPAEVLLVLHEPDDDMRALAKRTPRARVLHDGVDLGIVLGWNLGLAAARTDHVCIVHEDAAPRPGAGARLLATLRARPDAGAVGPRNHGADGQVLDEGSVMWSDAATTRIVGRPDGSIHPVDYASSACLLLDREAAVAVGGFDELAFPAVYADACMSMALWRSGRTVLCDTGAANDHVTGAMVDPSRGPRRSQRFRAFLLERNRGRFRDAYAEELEGFARRADAFDARHPSADELADADARLRERERRVLAGLVSPAPAVPLCLPDDLTSHVAELRRQLDDEFLAALIAREEELVAENASLHERYGELHRELDRVHAAYAELHRAHTGS